MICFHAFFCVTFNHNIFLVDPILLTHSVQHSNPIKSLYIYLNTICFSVEMSMYVIQQPAKCIKCGLEERGQDCTSAFPFMFQKYVCRLFYEYPGQFQTEHVVALFSLWNISPPVFKEDGISCWKDSRVFLIVLAR